MRFVIPGVSNGQPAITTSGAPERTSPDATTASHARRSRLGSLPNQGAGSVFTPQTSDSRRRTRVMIVMAGVWAGSWLLLGSTGLLPGTLTAAIGVLAFMGVFAFGETLLQPTVPAMYNDLATDRNRGRTNAINAAAFQGGAITGPIAAGILLDLHLEAWYIAVMVLGCVGIGVLARALERHVSPSVNGVPASAHAVE